MAAMRIAAADRQARRVTNQRAIAERLARQETLKSYPVLLGAHIEPGAAYLVESHPFPGDPPALRLFNAHELGDYLKGNITHAHYSGDAVEITGMWRWSGPGELVPLTITASGGDKADEEDYITTHHVVFSQAPGQLARVEFDFYVHIDGRA